MCECVHVCIYMCGVFTCEVVCVASDVGTGEEQSRPGSRKGPRERCKRVAPASGDLSNGLAQPHLLAGSSLELGPLS